MSYSFSTKAVGTIILLTVGSELAYQIYLRFVRRRIHTVYRKLDPSKNKPDVNSVNKVLFFPDKSVACKQFFLFEDGCQNKKCSFSHEKSSLGEMFCYLNSAKQSLDVCVFTISCEDLVDLVIEKARGGVKVRVITDDEQVNVPGSQIWKLRRAGIALRTDNSSFFMHHKFVIIDDSILINGSFNWTRQAITGNQENLMILNQRSILTEFQREFNKLWIQFEPKV